MAALAGGPALAQDEGARFTIGGGAGVSYPFHGDLDFHAAGWEVVARGTPAAHLTVEAFASTWRHTTETRRIGLPLQGPSGVIGTVGELSQRTRDQIQAFGVSLLPTFSAGRATFVVGGGANVDVLPASIRARAPRLRGDDGDDLRPLLERPHLVRSGRPRRGGHRRPRDGAVDRRSGRTASSSRFATLARVTRLRWRVCGSRCASATLVWLRSEPNPRAGP